MGKRKVYIIKSKNIKSIEPPHMDAGELIPFEKATHEQLHSQEYCRAIFIKGQLTGIVQQDHQGGNVALGRNTLKA